MRETKGGNTDGRAIIIIVSLLTPCSRCMPLPATTCCCCGIIYYALCNTKSPS
jgi:hypothetical protein